MRSAVFVLALASAPSAQCHLDTLFAPDGEQLARFGSSIDASNGRILVGAPQHDGEAMDSGTAYLMEFSPDGYVVEQQLWPLEDQLLGGFGSSVALEGERALVVAAGMSPAVVYVFERGDEGWGIADELIASGDASGYGQSIALSGNTAVVGAWTAGDGLVYVFERQAGGVWLQVDELSASGPEDVAYFGMDVALDGGRLVVGATQSGDSGAAYVFERGPLGFQQIDRLTGSSSTLHDGFGSEVEVDGDRIVVSAPYMNLGGGYRGMVFVFESTSGAWVEVDALEPSIPSSAGFGATLDLLGDRIALGAPDGSVWFPSTSYAEVWSPSEQGWTREFHATGSTNYATSVALIDGGILIGSTLDQGVETGTGGVRIHTLESQAILSAGPIQLSLAAAETQTMAIDGCAELAGLPYAVVGSLSGTTPTVVDGVDVPLTTDAYSLLTVTTPSATMEDSVGLLDASGRASATFRLSQPTPALAGLVAHHAAVVLNLELDVVEASGAIPVELVP